MRKIISKKIVNICSFIFLIVSSLFIFPCPNASAQMFRDSAKECAICHFRWLDQMFFQGKGTDLAKYQKGREAASEMICYSCHNGIIVDSRERFWAKRGHVVGVKPSSKVVIPPEMPLDEEGKLVCGTCHTAHGIADSERGKETIYLRCSNINSELCKKCHVDKLDGTKMGNHPVDVDTIPIPKVIFANYGKEGKKKNQVICQTCHTVHGTTDKKLLVLSTNNKKGGDPSDATLCEACHTKNPSRSNLRLGTASHPVDKESQKLKLPSKWPNGQNIVLDNQGSVTCRTCHKPHNALKNSSILTYNNNDSSLCITCHQQQKIIAKTDHDLTITAPQELNLRSRLTSRTGACVSCHLPHNAENYKLFAKKLSSEKDVISAVCESCHRQNGCAQAKLVGLFTHPVNKKFNLKINGKLSFPLFNGVGERVEDGQITCLSCHDVHKWDPNSNNPGTGINIEGNGNNSFLRMANNKNSDLCITCHQDKEYLEKTDHDLRITAVTEKNIFNEDISKSGLCGSCHLAHNGTGPKIWAKVMPSDVETNSIETLCSSCHNNKGCAKSKLVGKFSHPLDRSIKGADGETYLPLFNVEGVRVSEGNITCASCHNPHQWIPNKPQKGKGKNTEGDVESSFLRIAYNNNSDLCKDCHGDKYNSICSTDHDLNITAPNEKNSQGKKVKDTGVCSACHLVHNGNSMKMWAKDLGYQLLLNKRHKDLNGQKSEFRMDVLCYSCHNEDGCAKTKLIGSFTHPISKNISLLPQVTTQLPLYMDGLKTGNGDVSCPSCHDIHKWSSDGLFSNKNKVKLEGTGKNSFLRIASAPSSGLCLDCHKDKISLLNTDHDLKITAPNATNTAGQNISQGGQCSSCHLPHNGKDVRMWAMDLSDKGDKVSQLCSSCHESSSVANKKIINDYSHPVNVTLNKLALTSTLPLYNEYGLPSDGDRVTCTTCHNIHQWSQGLTSANFKNNTEGNIRSSFLRLSSEDYTQNICLDCHKEQRYIMGSEHDLAFTAVAEKNILGEGIKEGGACSACHLVHNGKEKTLLWAKPLGRRDDFMVGACISCHKPDGCAKSKAVFIGIHPTSFVYTGKVKTLNTFKTSFRKTYFPLYLKDGKKDDNGFVTCATCHTAHQWDPQEKFYNSTTNIEGNPSNSFLRNKGASFSICLDCHGFDAIFKYTYYHEQKEWKQQYWFNR
ncbi:MAG: cytochrome c3 family protein [bacterium]